ncbi:hypothetical protein EV360DRAFT_76345 [Lentinula raphanica]|nr:hypothetical protein EV360DRAFT_76345 [Lentinula raphanica]
MFFAAVGIAVLALPVPNDVISTLPSAIDVHTQASPAAIGREISVSKRMDQNPRVPTNPSSYPPATLEPPLVAPAGPPSGFPTRFHAAQEQPISEVTQSHRQTLPPIVVPPATPLSYDHYKQHSATNTVRVPAESAGGSQHVTQPPHRQEPPVVHPAFSRPQQVPQGQHSNPNTVTKPESWIPAAIHGNPNPGVMTFLEWNEKYGDQVVNVEDNMLYRLEIKPLPPNKPRFGGCLWRLQRQSDFADVHSNVDIRPLTPRMTSIKESNFYQGASAAFRDRLQELFKEALYFSAQNPKKTRKLFNAYFILATEADRLNKRIQQIKQSEIYRNLRFKTEYDKIFDRVERANKHEFVLEELDMIHIYLADDKNDGYESSCQDKPEIITPSKLKTAPDTQFHLSARICTQHPDFILSDSMSAGNQRVVSGFKFVNPFLQRPSSQLSHHYIAIPSPRCLSLKKGIGNCLVDGDFVRHTSVNTTIGTNEGQSSATSTRGSLAFFKFVHHMCNLTLNPAVTCPLMPTYVPLRLIVSGLRYEGADGTRDGINGSTTCTYPSRNTAQRLTRLKERVH